MKIMNVLKELLKSQQSKCLYIINTFRKISWKNKDSEFGPVFSYLDFILHATSRDDKP